ncbi:complex I NDUFA9 subunit family protein [Thioalkalivibrio nitratireducens]|uniref:complex I NDUFA9 subunit family protein n=1 Tax=Thioalkalivibrio nitratireducens TaxID=186931 RepID=UPI0005C1A832
MSIKSVCLLGGTGFVGRHIVARLTDRGMAVRVLTRHMERHRDLKVMPEVDLAAGDPHDPATLEDFFAGADAVINLVGILNEKGRDGSGFRKAHIELTEKALAAATDQGLRRFVQMSALKADMPDPPSQYLRSKAEAERAVFAASAFPVTVFRPSVIFGPEDSFLNRFAGLLKIAPFMPLARAEARFAPVFVGDVADHFVNCLDDPATFGKGFELCGPRIYTLRELVRYTARLTRRRRPIVPLPGWAGRLQATVFEFVPGKPLSRDNLASLSVDSVCTGETLPCPTLLEAVAPAYLGQEGHQARMQRLRTGTRE